MNRYGVLVTVVFSAAMTGILPAAAAPTVGQPGAGPACQPTGGVMRLAGLAEASGLVASRAIPGRLWAHNDSGNPDIFALDAKGKVAGRVSLSGAKVQDWEAMTSGPCASGTCLYVGDIGDNAANRASIVVYRVPEPAQLGGSATVDGVFRASYPDGAHDAETLFAASDGALYVVTKGETGHAALYRFPRELRTGATMRLERVGAPLSARPLAEDARITDGAISRDGTWVVLRTLASLTFYAAPAFLKGDFREARRLDLRPLKEPQGEGITFGPANTVFLAGEGGGKSQPGTLAALSCDR